MFSLILLFSAVYNTKQNELQEAFYQISLKLCKCLILVGDKFLLDFQFFS